MEQLKVLEEFDHELSDRKFIWTFEKSIFPYLSGKIDTCVSVPTFHSSSYSSKKN